MRLPLLRSNLCVAALVLSAMLPIGAHAAPCVGFTDVDDSSTFCPNVEWLKNRAITLGCTSATLYCPTGFVTRGAMAAFINRLGLSLNPVHRKLDFASGGTVDIDVNPVICATPDYAIVGAPRTVHGHALLSGSNNGSTADVAAQYVESTNGGASWTPVSPNHASTASMPQGQRATVNVMLPPRDLVVGTTYRYALRLSRVAGSATTGDFGNYICSVRATFENRNGVTSPLDEDD